MNAYKVWAGDLGYEIVIAKTPIEAKLSYWSNFDDPRTMFEEGADMHCRLIEKDVETSDGIAYEQSRHYDLIFAGITHPDWAEERMAYDWWWES